MTTPKAVHSQETHSLVSAFKALKDQKLDTKYFASGLVISIEDLSGQHLCEFMIRGEDFAPVRATLLEAARSAMDERMKHLNWQVNDIKKATES